MELARLEGREAVFIEADGTAFAADPFGITFEEQIAFLRQKRARPTKVWTDALYGDHDRAFVVAGVTNMAMLDEFQTAVAEAVDAGDIRAFEKDFDRLVEKYGWSYKGGRDWRIRTIFETNLRTSYMAGRLKQMLAVTDSRPYWQYVHADTRIPLNPRPEHVAWNKLVLLWNDPWWETYFPPNDWLCSCGVRTLSADDLARLGKTGPDKAPETKMVEVNDPATGGTVSYPEGIGYGWAYQPGAQWARGLVPQQLEAEGGGLSPETRQLVVVDRPSPISDLLASAKPFTARPLPEGLSDEDYIRGFLTPFGADIGRPVVWEDPTGARLPVSEDYFRMRDGRLKIGKRNRAMLTPLMAETLMDPDEIWIGLTVRALADGQSDYAIDRRYIRADPDHGFNLVLELGRRWWTATTAYETTTNKGQFSPRLLDKRRGGKLVWKRK